jgi:hypothetical protein
MQDVPVVLIFFLYSECLFFYILSLFFGYEMIKDIAEKAR